jgi:hypothetical protein
MKVNVDHKAVIEVLMPTGDKDDPGTRLLVDIVNILQAINKGNWYRSRMATRRSPSSMLMSRRRWRALMA